jgi:hypothetical protein
MYHFQYHFQYQLHSYSLISIASLLLSAVLLHTMC